MSSKPNHRLSKTRQGQRSHAKQRFQERFQLEMNRDRIHEIENNIISGKAVAIESKRGKTNYFVEVEGRLVIVGYDPATHRVATALPAEYIRKISAKMLVLAPLRLLRSEQERVIADITSGKARLLRDKGDVALYEVEYDGILLKVGYNSQTNRLCLLREKAGSKGKPKLALASGQTTEAPPLTLLALDAATAEACRKQIQDGTSLFLWRHSNSVTFQQVEVNGEKLKVGYSRTRRVFFRYEDPAEARVELRSSLRLLGMPSGILQTVTQIVSMGKAELVCMRDSDRGSYRVEHEGEVYYFDYSSRTGLLGPWNQGK